MGERVRDPERTRRAVLDAAEALFAAKGFAATSLQEIADRAGVSRGTPSYFFATKERLYQAVLDRVFAEFWAALDEARQRVVAEGGAPEAVLQAEVEAYLDVLVARPTIVRLVEWEALAGGAHLGASRPHVDAVRRGLAAVGEELARGGFRGADPAQVLLSVVALCWFPLAHADTLARAVGVDPFDPAFVAARKRHIVDLVLHGIRGCGEDAGSAR